MWLFSAARSKAFNAGFSPDESLCHYFFLKIKKYFIFKSIHLSLGMGFQMKTEWIKLI